jgi:hypothetical protein
VSRHPDRGVLAVLLLLSAVGAVGCTNPDAPRVARERTRNTSPQNRGESPAPPPRASASQAPGDVQGTPPAALAAFADLYANWNYRTLAAEQRQLAAMSVGAARLAEQQAAAAIQTDSTISQGHIYNTGRVASIGPDLLRPGMWVVLTREQTGGDTQYEGLPAAYHLTLAQVAAVPGGYAVSEWLPQN